jgi:23S rRNA pseudouridine1911/1915/1917 synthase
VQRFVLGPDQAHERVDKALTILVPDASRETIKRWIKDHRVRLDGKVCRPHSEVRPGSVVEVEPEPPLPTQAVPDPTVPFRVLHEDPHLIVVDKPAGVVVHPSRGHHGGTLVNGLLAHGGFEQASADPRDPEGWLRPGVVHRIDKDTSGVLVIAKVEVAREGLKEQLSSHTVERVYTAITLGVPPAETISTLHGRHPRSRLRYTTNVRLGRAAVTHVKPLAALAGDRAALVECRLETGRTHQIRVHLAERTRTPILADSLYGRRPDDADVARISTELGRQALHAGVLGFVHPVTGEMLRFESPLPEDFQQALASLRALGSRPLTT